jgi:predicted RNase H-like nuclease (RuvC/YqgF family)
MRKDVIHTTTHFDSKFVAPCLKQRRQDLNRCLEVYDKKLFKLKLKNDKLSENAEKHREAFLNIDKENSRLVKKIAKLERKLESKGKE